MKRKPTFTTSLGSISGLDPQEDPIGDLAYTLRRLLKTCRVDRDTRKAHLEVLHDAENLIATYEPEDYESPVNNVEITIDALCDALEHYAPPYACFGARENDRGETVYGFWPDLDNDLPRLEAGHESGHPGFWGEDVLLVNDHGNVDCGRFDKRGRWHEYWSCV